MRRCGLTTFSGPNCLGVSAAVLYVGGRPLAEAEHVGVHVVVFHPPGQTQDAHCRRADAGQETGNRRRAASALKLL